MIKIEKENSDNILLTSKLQQGVWVEYTPGETVTSFILRILSVRKEVMDREVQTLILNNGCVDDPENKTLDSGDTLVLSGAMPGLVGAMLRSNSPIKAMRQTLSNTSQKNNTHKDGNFIKVKLFNSVLADHKQDLLQTGFYLEDLD
ncbi:MAG: hypothetical protein PF518_09230 [Spirochaetaceae bacterium]|nr:hypothetical protein [Spirochaetaceae bacterium]